VALHHRVTVSYQAAHKAKKTILGDGLQQQGNQFRLLPAYLDAVRTSEPQAVVHLQRYNFWGICFRVFWVLTMAWSRWYGRDGRTFSCIIAAFHVNRMKIGRVVEGRMGSDGVADSRG